MRKPLFALAFALVLAACSPPAAPSPPTAPAAPVAPTAPAAPAKTATMICRNSQTGAKVACGAPNAVMVGIKED